jgi:ABC-type glycerol-3-phosphate transport system permease component
MSATTTARINARAATGLVRKPGGRRARDLLVIVPTLLIMAVIVFPVLWMVFSSLRPEAVLTGSFDWGSILDGLSLNSYGRLFSGSNFGLYIVNSLIVSCSSTVCTVIIASIAAYALSRFRFRFRGPILLGIIATQLLPFVVLITPIYLVFSQLGLLNNYLGLVIVYVAMTLPLAIYLMLGYFDVIPNGLDEAARIDGCSTLAIIFRVVLPVAWPGIVTVTVTAFIATWEEFLFAGVLMTDDAKKTVQVGLSGFFGEYATDWGVVMAASVIAAIPTIVLFTTIQKRLVAGMAAGSIKE